MPGRVKQLARLIVRPPVRQNALHDWRRQRGGEPGLPPGPMRQILLCCTGNICRSPFAGRLLAGLRPELSIRSAGFQARDRDFAEPAALRVATRFGVDLTRHQARPLSADDVDWADLVLVMEGHHLVRLRRDWPSSMGKARLLGDFLPEPPHTIEDPWGLSDDVFVFTFERIALALRRLSDRLDARDPRCSGGS